MICRHVECVLDAGRLDNSNQVVSQGLATDAFSDPRQYIGTGGFVIHLSGAVQQIIAFYSAQKIPV